MIGLRTICSSLFLVAFMFLNIGCLKSEGDPSVPCVGKNCAKPKNRSRPIKPDTGTPPSPIPSLPPVPPDPTPTPTPVNPAPPAPPPPASAYPASASCHFEFRIEDQPPGFSPVVDPNVIPPTGGITEVKPTKTEDFLRIGMNSDLMISSQNNYTYNCLEAALRKYKELEEAYCPLARPKKEIKTRTKIVTKFTSGVREDLIMDTGERTYSCKSREVISGYSAYGEALASPSGLHSSRLAANYNGYKALCLSSIFCSHPAANYGLHAGELRAIVIDSSNSPGLAQIALRRDAYLVVQQIRFRAAYLTPQQAPDPACGNRASVLRIEIPTLTQTERTQGLGHFEKQLSGYDIPDNGTFGGLIDIPIGVSTQGWIIIRSCTPAVIKDLEVWVK